MRYNLYKLAHLVGLMTLFTGLAGLLWMNMVGARDEKRAKRAAAIFHGVGLVLILVSGFGMLPMWSATGFPLWAVAKILVWLALGGAIALANRKSHLGWPVAVAFIAMGAASAYLGLYKPF
jgi:hypothetical protein